MEWVGGWLIWSFVCSSVLHSFIHLCINEPTNKSINHSVIHWINQSTSPVTEQITNRLIHRWVIDDLTLFAHSSAEALLQATVSALVAFVLIDDATSVEPTRVRVVLTHTASEESFTSVARGSTVVFPRCSVTADGAHVVRWAAILCHQWAGVVCAAV